MINVFGAIMQSAIVEATQAEWRKLGSASQACVNDTLRQRGLNLQTLIGNGVTPSDSRIASIVANCTSQPPAQPYANVRLQPSNDSVGADALRSGQSSKYRVDKIALGSIVEFESANYREYQCRPSDQFSGFTWCQKQRNERVPRGEYLSSYSLLHSQDGRLSYLNRYLEPAFFDPGEVSADIDRLTHAFGEQPRTIEMPRNIPNVTGVIASWGAASLEPLDASAIAALAAGRSPGGILIDFVGDFQQSIHQKLPIYRVSGGAGFVWAESHDFNGRGRLRFFAIDALSLSSSPTSEARQEPSVAVTTPTDPWKDCQSANPEARLAGCTRVIEAKGVDRVRLADAFDGRCSAYNQTQQYQSALADCKAAIDSNPRYSYAYANLGASYLGLNDTPNALISLNKAIDLKSNFVWSRLSRAKARVAAGSTQEGLQDYQYALLIDPLNQAAKDGLLSLTTPDTGAQMSDSCLPAPVDRSSQATGSEIARKFDATITEISSVAQSYREQLTRSQVKLDQLSRDKDASERKQLVLAGSADDRKKLLNDVQRSTDDDAESQTRFDDLTQRLAEQEDKLHRLETAGGTKSQLKEAQQSITKLRSVRADAERDLHRKTGDRDEAISRAQRRAAEIAAPMADIKKIDVAKNAAESCVRQIKAGIDALDQKADDLRQKGRAQAAAALRLDAEHLITDLTEFAQKNASLVPLEIGPLVATLKSALAGQDNDKISIAFGNLQKRLDEVPEFKRYRTSREEVRQQAAKSELEQLQDTARTISEFIASYVRANITSDAAQDLLKVRTSILDALAVPDAEALKAAIPQAEKDLERFHVETAYHDYRGKHPIQSRRSLPTATDRNRYLVEGALDETLVLVNESGQAGVVRNLRGDLVFESDKATMCFAHDNNLDAFAISELKRKLADHGARTLNVLAGVCQPADFDKYDLIAVNRGLLATVSTEIAAAILAAADKGDLTLLTSISERELQVARNGDSIKSLQLENDLLKRAVDGFGVVVVKNSTSVVCQTVTSQQKAHESLLSHDADRLELEFGAPASTISTSIDSAFVAAKRGQCGAIYGAAKDLRELVTSLQRDKLSYHVVPIWFSTADVDAEQTKIADHLTSEIRAQEALEQKKRDDQVRRAVERKQTNAERTEREAQLRQQNGSLARGMADSVLSRIKTFSSEAGDGMRVAQEWPSLAKWFGDQRRQEWELESVSGDLLDYGVVEWKSRVLEAGFVAVRFKMKQRALGEYQEKCFSVGYTADHEFDVERDPIAVPCEDESTLSRYKVAHSFTSKWFAH
jgi:tetratricopeptide (TPR) repeat protein